MGGLLLLFALQTSTLPPVQPTVEEGRCVSSELVAGHNGSPDAAEICAQRYHWTTAVREAANTEGVIHYEMIRHIQLAARAGIQQSTFQAVWHSMTQDEIEGFGLPATHDDSHLAVSARAAVTHCRAAGLGDSQIRSCSDLVMYSALTVNAAATFFDVWRRDHAAGGQP